MSFLNFVISGISLGSIYAIIALGYTMVYGIAKMLNFAHGDVIMVGAYICFFAASKYNLPPIVGVLLAMLVCTVLGMVIEKLAYKPLRAAPILAVLITAIGVSYFLQNAALLLWSSNPKVFKPVVPTGSRITLFDGQLSVSVITILTIVSCIIIMMPPTRNIRFRTSILSEKSTSCWIEVMSAVSLVTREPVVNLSVCWNERDMTFPKTSRRRSRAKPCEAQPLNAAEPTPQAPPTTIVSSIITPVETITSMFWGSTPSSTICDRSFGCKRSTSTSPIMVRGVSSANSR